MDDLYWDAGYWHDAGVEELIYEGNTIKMLLCLSENFAPDGSDFPSVNLSVTWQDCAVLTGEEDIQAVQNGLKTGDSIEVLTVEGDLAGSGVIKLHLNVFSFKTRESSYAAFELSYKHLDIKPVG